MISVVSSTSRRDKLMAVPTARVARKLAPLAFSTGHQLVGGVAPKPPLSPCTVPIHLFVPLHSSIHSSVHTWHQRITPQSNSNFMINSLLATYHFSHHTQMEFLLSSSASDLKNTQSYISNCSNSISPYKQHFRPLPLHSSIILPIPLYSLVLSLILLYNFIYPSIPLYIPILSLIALHSLIFLSIPLGPV